MFWSVREYLKSQMLQLVRQRVHTQLVRNRGSESHLDRLFRYADPGNPNVLTVGFGRRFATYKRSTLLFKDLDALRQIVCNPERPVLFIFTGKAHPDDQPGQDLIRHIMQVAKMPEFVGHLLLVEGYDLRLARRLVAGVDVWLNNPIHPLEASGTSGMKAAMNGAHQPLGARRLVGRGLRRDQWLGDQAGVGPHSNRRAAISTKRTRSTRSCRITCCRSITRARASPIRPDGCGWPSAR